MLEAECEYEWSDAKYVVYICILETTNNNKIEYILPEYMNTQILVLLWKQIHSKLMNVYIWNVTPLYSSESSYLTKHAVWSYWLEPEPHVHHTIEYNSL